MQRAQSVTWKRQSDHPVKLMYIVGNKMYLQQGLHKQLSHVRFLV